MQSRPSDRQAQHSTEVIDELFSHWQARNSVWAVVLQWNPRGWFCTPLAVEFDVMGAPGHFALRESFWFLDVEMRIISPQAPLSATFRDTRSGWRARCR